MLQQGSSQEAVVRLPSVLTIALGIALCLGTAGCGTTTVGPSPSMSPGQETPATMQANVTLRWINGGEQVQHGTVSMSSGGAYRWDVTLTKDTMMVFPAGSHFLQLYNATSHRSYELYTDAKGHLTLGGSQFNTSSPLFGGDSSSYLGLGRYAAVVEAALADGDPKLPVKEISFEGRAAFQLDQTGYYPSEPKRPAYYVRVIVDKATGLPLFVSRRIAATGKDRQLEEVRFDHLRLGIALPVSTFAPPTGVSLPGDHVRNDFVHFTSLKGAAARVGYDPLLPDPLPAGWELATVATTPKDQPYLWIPDATMGGPFVDWSTLPDTVTQTVFSRGLHCFSISMAPIGSDTGVPGGLANAVTRLVGHATSVLDGGDLAGRTASYWFDPSLGSLGLVVSNDSVIVFITGDLSPHEMLGVANSLRPCQP
jgi:hypothetical protein